MLIKQFTVYNEIRHQLLFVLLLPSFFPKLPLFPVPTHTCICKHQKSATCPSELLQWAEFGFSHVRSVISCNVFGCRRQRNYPSTPRAPEYSCVSVGGATANINLWMHWYHEAETFTKRARPMTLLTITILKIYLWGGYILA